MTHQSPALLAQPTGRLEGMCCAWEGNLIFQVLEFIIKKTPKPTKVAANKRHVKTYMAIKHHSLFWLHRVVCSQFFSME